LENLEKFKTIERKALCRKPFDYKGHRIESADVIYGRNIQNPDIHALLIEVVHDGGQKTTVIWDRGKMPSDTNLEDVTWNIAFGMTFIPWPDIAVSGGLNAEIV